MQPTSHPIAGSPNGERAPTPARQADPPCIYSHDLLQGNNLILIEHEGARYYLRMTRNNKLILTK